jgi:hypothetical protein
VPVVPASIIDPIREEFLRLLPERRDSHPLGCHNPRIEDAVVFDLLAWMRVLLLDGELATAEPKKLRYRLLHVAARLTRGGRRLRLRISTTWPWRHELATAFHRLATLPRPAG